jgi:hypothetical protein
VASETNVQKHSIAPSRPVPKQERRKAQELQVVAGGTEELAAGRKRGKGQPVSQKKAAPSVLMLPLPLQFLAAWLAVKDLFFP